jgi:hypothetical protein
MKRIAILIALTVLIVSVTAKLAIAADGFIVVPSAFDPHQTHLVAAEWEGGIGCPTNATVVPFAPPNYDTLGPPYSYTDPACPIGKADSSDKRNEGLLLVKTGPQNNDAAAGAELLGVKGTVLSELGYDIRKPGPGTPIVVVAVTLTGDQNDPRGSHCGAGAPRFNIAIGGFLYFLACNSPAPDTDNAGNGWQRLRWGTPTDLSASPQCHDNNCKPNPNNPCTPSTVHGGYCNIKGETVDSIEIVFDEGDDIGPDNFGLAVLDNIDLNGTLVGKGPEENENKDDDRAQGDDGKGDSFQSDDSPSRPETSSMSYEDRSQGMKMQSVNGARSVTYTGPCVSYAGDAVMTGNPGYLFTFEACGVSLLGTGIGTFSMTVTGPAGYLYQKSALLTSGYVNIHPH